MNKAWKNCLLVMVYLGGSGVTFCGLAGDYNWHCRNRWPTACNQYRAREEMGFKAIVSAIPPFWVMAAGTTGFYQHGFSLSFVPTAKSDLPP